MSDCNIVRVNGWDLAQFEEESERHVRDMDLAERLEHPQPRAFRRLIKRYLPELENFGEIQQRVTVTRYESRPGIQQERRTVEYWLNERQAMFLICKSELPKANEMTVDLVNAFYALRTIAATAMRQAMESIDRRLLRIEAKQIGPGFVQADQAADIVAKIDSVAQARVDRDPSLSFKSEKMSIDNAVRFAIGFNREMGCGWAFLPLSKLGDAQLEIRKFEARERATRKRLEKLNRLKGQTQLPLNQ